MCMSRYAKLAATATTDRRWSYAPGARLPSVRELSREYGVSISTVQQAYLQLKNYGWCIPKGENRVILSVCVQQFLRCHLVSRPVQRPVEISQWDHV